MDLSVIHAGTIDYTIARKEQERIHNEVVSGTAPDTILLLEHPSVYTAGKRTSWSDRPVDGTPVIDTDRGGRITWHGPGQLVGYPIIKLPEPIDVIAYIRRVEQLLIHVCAELGIVAIRIEDRSGVWISASSQRQERKIAAIGVRVARGVTLHGFSLNCDCDLSAFNRIVPCGISDAGVTSLSEELGEPFPVIRATPIVERHLANLYPKEK